VNNLTTTEGGCRNLLRRPIKGGTQKINGSKGKRNRTRKNEPPSGSKGVRRGPGESGRTKPKKQKIEKNLKKSRRGLLREGRRAKRTEKKDNKRNQWEKVGESNCSSKLETDVGTRNKCVWGKYKKNELSPSTRPRGGGKPKFCGWISLRQMAGWKALGGEKKEPARGIMYKRTPKPMLRHRGQGFEQVGATNGGERDKNKD